MMDTMARRARGRGVSGGVEEEERARPQSRPVIDCEPRAANERHLLLYSLPRDARWRTKKGLPTPAAAARSLAPIS